MNAEWHNPLPKHLARPSFAPAILAAGLVCVLWGLVTTWLISLAGLVIAAYGAWLWMGADLAGAAVEPVPGAAEASPVAAAGPRAATAPAKIRAAQAVSPWVHPFAVSLACGWLLLMITGALVTSRAPIVSESQHTVAALAVGLATIGLGLGAGRAGWILVALTAMEALLGRHGIVVGTFHALLAHLVFGATVAVAVYTSRAWKREPELVPDMKSPSLKTLAVVTVAFALLQVALGSAVRHKAMGVSMHLIGALVVALLILLTGVLVMNQSPNHRVLRPFAIAMMVTTGAQVFLGFAAFIVRIMADEATAPVVISTVAHVTTGALTFASTIAMAIHIWRNVGPAAEGTAGEGAGKQS